MLINKITMKRLLSFFNRPKPLPEEGSFYTHKKPGAYFGMSGIVHHHLDKRAFMLFTGNSWLVNIKP